MIYGGCRCWRRWSPQDAAGPGRHHVDHFVAPGLGRPTVYVRLRRAVDRYCAGMRVAVRTRYGSPKVLQMGEPNKPTTGAALVIARVHATTVKRTDCACRA